MWIRSIELEHWRVFDRKRVRIGELSSGLNLLFGPNECGKSTTIDAMARLLFDRPKTSSASVLRPWGSDVTPDGALELDSGGKRYRIEKRFHPTSGFAALKLDRGSGFVDFKQDDAVQDFIHEMVGSQRVLRGLSKYENWGWIHLLWALQDEPVLPQAVDPEIQERLGPALAQNPLADPGRVEPLLQEVQKLYAVWFTATGKPVKSGPLNTLEELQTRLGSELEVLEQDLQRADELALQLREELEEQREFAAHLQQLEREKDRLAQEYREFEQLKSRRAQLALRVQAARIELEQRQHGLAQIKEQTAQQEMHGQLARDAEAKLIDLRRLREEARTAFREAEKLDVMTQESYSAARVTREASRARAALMRELTEQNENLRRVMDALAESLEAQKQAQIGEDQAHQAEVAASYETVRLESLDAQFEAAVESAQLEVETATLVGERERVSKELESVQAAKIQIDQLVAARQELRPPSDADLKLLVRVESDLIETRARIQAEKLAVSVTAERKLQPSVRIDGIPEEATIPKGTTARFEGARLLLVFPGVASIEIGRPGAAERESRRLESLVQQRAELLSRYGATDTEILRSTAQQARELDREIELRRDQLREHPEAAALQERLASLPSGGLDLNVALEQLGSAKKARKSHKDAVGRALRKREQAREAYATARRAAQSKRDHRAELAGKASGMEAGLAAALVAARIEAGPEGIEAALRESVIAVSLAERNAAESESQRNKLREDVTRAQAELARVENDISSRSSDQRNHLLAQQQAHSAKMRLMDGRDLDELKGLVSRSELAVEAARSDLSQLPLLPDVDPAKELESVEIAFRDLRQNREDRLARQASLQQQLSVLGSLGLYEKIAETRERLALTERHLQNEKLKAAAARHLKQLLESAQERARRRLGGPIRDWVGLRIRELIGDAAAEVEFSDRLELQRVLRRGLDGAVSVAELSRGTRDLLGALVRLGLGELASQRERQLVVLDDVLVHADAARRRRMLKILQEVAERVQILISTCHPDQYAGLGDSARRFDLESLARGA